MGNSWGIHSTPPISVVHSRGSMLLHLDVKHLSQRATLASKTPWPSEPRTKKNTAGYGFHESSWLVQLDPAQLGWLYIIPI